MKEFVFMYPTREYIGGLPEPKQDINELIQARYRKQGFHINWLMFSKRNGGADLAGKSELFEFHPEDRIIICGVTFERLVSGKEVSASRVVRYQLPTEIDELVIAGFHFWYCVNTLARYTHKVGIKTRVDEDLTEKFFLRPAELGPIPLIREELTPQERAFREKWQPEVLEHYLTLRRDKPWMPIFT